MRTRSPLLWLYLKQTVGFRRWTSLKYLQWISPVSGITNKIQQYLIKKSTCISNEFHKFLRYLKWVSPASKVSPVNFTCLCSMLIFISIISLFILSDFFQSYRHFQWISSASVKYLRRILPVFRISPMNGTRFLRVSSEFTFPNVSIMYL